jgi:hypothetical protein
MPTIQSFLDKSSIVECLTTYETMVSYNYHGNSFIILNIEEGCPGHIIWLTEASFMP